MFWDEAAKATARIKIVVLRFNIVLKFFTDRNQALNGCGSLIASWNSNPLNEQSKALKVNELLKSIQTPAHRLCTCTTHLVCSDGKKWTSTALISRPHISGVHAKNSAAHSKDQSLFITSWQSIISIQRKLWDFPKTWTVSKGWHTKTAPKIQRRF